MLANQYYYHALLRKYVVYFGSLFNDIAIERSDSNDTLIQTITVPISYGPKQKFIARLEQDPEAAREVAITLPRLSFEIRNIEYDQTRKLMHNRKLSKVILLIRVNTNILIHQYHTILHLSSVYIQKTLKMVYKLLNKSFHFLHQSGQIN